MSEMTNYVIIDAVAKDLCKYFAYVFAAEIFPN